MSDIKALKNKLFLERKNGRLIVEDEVLQKAYDEYVKTREELGRTKPQNLMDIATHAV